MTIDDEMFEGWAAQEAGGRLSPWSYPAKPLGPDDIGEQCLYWASTIRAPSFSQRNYEFTSAAAPTTPAFDNSYAVWCCLFTIMR